MSETPRSNTYAGLLASMPQLGAMFGEMVAMERELAAAKLLLGEYVETHPAAPGRAARDRDSMMKQSANKPLAPAQECATMRGDG